MTYTLLRSLLKPISKMPFKLMYIISDGLYPVLYYIVRYRRKIVRKNLTESFPDKSPEEIRRIEKKFYRNFIDNMLETCKMGAMSTEEMSRHMTFPNIEEVNKVLRSGQSIALYLGHYGNWEWISSMPIHLEKGVVAAQIYHKLSNEAMDRLMLENRAAHGATNVEMNRTARFIMELRAKHRESIIGFIADQSPRWADLHYFLPFLNHRTPVITGTEKIAKHYKFDVWFVHTKKIKRGYYEARFIRMHDHPDSLPDFELTDIYYRMLEDMIREQPELYLWTHNRFKHAEKLSVSTFTQNSN